MRVIKLSLLGSLAMAAFVVSFSTPAMGQDERLIGGGSGITVFEDRNFRGDAATYNSDMSSLPSKFRNKISSLRVGNGETWQICDQNNYRGQCVNVTGEEYDLDNNDWDNRISSLRRVGNSGGGWGGGGWNGGGQTSRPPSWAVGTFYSAYPSRTITLSSNGQVSVVDQGQTYYGRFYQNRIYLNNDVSTMQRWGNGIRTYNQNSGETTDYSRGGSGGGWNGGNNDDNGPTTTPPSWAVGTFRSTNSNDNISLQIDRNGRITVVNNGQTYYGRYYGGQMYLNNDVSSISRNGNGIQTYNRNTGATTNYRRR